jgi:hypothetical protein
MADDCLLKILDPEVKKKLFGDREIGDDVLKRLHQDIEAIKNAADQSPEGKSFPSRVREYLSRKRNEAAIDQAKLKNDLQLRKQNMAFYGQKAFAGDPTEGFLTRLATPTTLAEGGMYSAEGRVSGIGTRLMSKLYTTLNDAGALKIMIGGKLDLEVREGVWALEKGLPMPESVSEQGAKIAQLVSDHNKRLLQEEHNNGVPTRMLEGRAASRTHDPGVIREAGFEQWKNDVRQMGLDGAKTFGDHNGNVEKEDQILEGIYKAVTGGKTGADSIIEKGDVDQLFKSSNFSNKLSASRQLVFDSAKGDFLYNEKYAKYNLLETMAKDVTRRSRMLGLIGTYGSNPEGNLRKEIQLAINGFKRAGDHESAEKLRIGERRIMDVYHLLSGQGSIPGVNMVAKIENTALALNAQTKLFYTQAKSLGNFSTIATRMSDLNGKPWLQNIADSVVEWVKTLPPGQKDRMMEDAGFFIRDFHSQMPGLGFGDSLLGRSEKFNKIMFTMFGHTITNEGFKVAATNMMMKQMGHAVEEGLERQDPRLQATFRQMGITTHDAEILKNGIQQTKAYTLTPSRKMLTPEGISKIDPELVKSTSRAQAQPFKDALKAARKAVLAAQGTDGEEAAMAAASRAEEAYRPMKARADAIAKNPEGYLSEMNNRMMSGIKQVQDDASTTAGVRERAWATGGRAQGDVTRLFTQLVGQFKTYSVQDINLMKKSLNSIPNRLEDGSLAAAGKNYASVGKFMVGSAAAGMVGLTLKDLYQGKGLPDYRDPSTYLQAIAFGGAGGMLVDYLAGGNKYFGQAETFLGPTIGQVAGPLAKVVAGARDDLVNYAHPLPGVSPPMISKSTKKQALALVRQNIPYQQFPGIKQFLDYAQFNAIGEYIDPGAMQRKEIKEMKAKMRREYARGGTGD